MDYEIIKMALMALNMLLTLALWLFALNDRKQRATTQSIKELALHVEKKLEAKCARLSKLEHDVGKIPGRDEFSQELRLIYQRINEINEGSKQTHLLLGKLLGEARQRSDKN